MEIVDFDPHALEAIYHDRAGGPYDVIEPLPKAVADWKNRLHPVTKKPTKLVDISWQKNMGTIILDSFEFHVHAWTMTAVKKREALDKVDTRDHAQSLFTLDRDATFRAEGVALLALRTPHAPTATVNAIAAAEAALKVAQAAAIDVLVADATSPVTEKNRPVLTSYCELTTSELQILDEFTRVFDKSRSHFVFEIVTPQTRRLLNAARIQADSATTPVPLKWADYRKLLLDRMTGGASSNDLLSYLLKSREEGLTISLWTAERRAERHLLEKDGVVLAENIWLSYVLHFVSAHERQTLKIPAEKDRAAFNASAGYTCKDLEAAIASTDPLTFQRFR